MRQRAVLGNISSGAMRPAKVIVADQARIVNDSPFCDAWVATEKIIERLLAMASEGASIDQVAWPIADPGLKRAPAHTGGRLSSLVFFGGGARKIRSICGPCTPLE
jgi:hypothetical protein